MTLAKITSKGQLTIPKHIRDHLQLEMVPDTRLCSS